MLSLLPGPCAVGTCTPGFCVGWPTPGVPWRPGRANSGPTSKVSAGLPPTAPYPGGDALNPPGASAGPTCTGGMAGGTERLLPTGGTVGDALCFRRSALPSRRSCCHSHAHSPSTPIWLPPLAVRHHPVLAAGE